ncbi:hypothetical protein AAVH_14808 [Aphelenchoides avenae]|nr:hypothetical protein AAVH_41424 [Aphelenchus avenae]KAH7717734.1 hypothetical protein AAVH_14808 [Aphelenchus avenae]
MLSAVTSKILGVVLVLVLDGAETLSCYETTEDAGIEVVDNANWTYCAMIPSRILEDGTYRPGRAFGVGSDTDTTDVYWASFGHQIPFVETLSFCIMERYDWSLMFRNMGERPAPEFLFRCVCKQDLCNDPNHFNGFLPRGMAPVVDDAPDAGDLR